jgi:photosystem II stability/assembly factor-like uncharacterized protein
MKSLSKTAASTARRSLAIFTLACALSSSAPAQIGHIPAFSEVAPPRTEPDRKDEPGEAQAYFLEKRAIDGKRDLPFDRYVRARDFISRMPHVDIATGRASSFKKAGSRQLSLGAWKELGPTNIAGRARALVFDPRDPQVIYIGAAAGGVFKSVDAAASWRAIGDMLPNMAVNALAIDPKNPDTLYAGTGEGYNNIDAVRGNGIFKSTDAGQTWSALDSTRDNSAFFFVNKIVISPHDSQRLYAATGQGIFRSLDGGASWQRVLERMSPFDGCADLVARPGATGDYLYAACGRFFASAVFRHKNAEGDAPWEEVLAEPNMGRSVIAIAPSQPDTVYVLSASLEFGRFNQGFLALFRSQAAGDKDSFEKRVTNQSDVRMNTMLLSNQSGFFADLCSGGAQRIASQGWYDIALAVDPVNPDVLWAGGIDLFRSDDAGANWGLASDWFVDPEFRTYVHADQHLIVFHPRYDGVSNKTVYFVNDGGLNATEDSSSAVLTNDKFCDDFSSFTHRTLTSGMGTAQFYQGLPYPGGAAWLGGKQDNGTSRGTAAGGPGKWREIQGGDGGYVAIAPDDPNRIYAETTRLSLRRATNGVTFTSAINGITETSTNFSFIAPFRMDPNDSRKLYIGGRTLWRTTNGATNWSAMSQAIPIGNISAMAAAPGNPERVAFGTSTGRLYLTNSATAENVVDTWTQTFIRLNGNVSWLEFDPTNTDILYATVSTFNNASGEGHVFRSTDGGANWARRDSGLPDIPAHSVAIDPARPEHIYVGTDLGIFFSPDSGATWAKEDSTFANTVIESISIVRENGASTLTAFTHGRGVWQVHLGGESPACEFKLSASDAVPAFGGLQRLNLEAGPDCVWSAVPDSNWARSLRASGKGSGEIPIQVAINASPNAREARLSLADKDIVVRQQGATPVSGNATSTEAFTLPQSPFVGLTNSRHVPAEAPDSSPVHSCTESRDSRHTWFKFVPGFSGRIYLSAVTFSAAGLRLGSVVALYEGEASAASERACGRSATQPEIQPLVEAGKTYFIQAAGLGANNPGGDQVFLLGRLE